MLNKIPQTSPIKATAPTNIPKNKSKGATQTFDSTSSVKGDSFERLVQQSSTGIPFSQLTAHRQEGEFSKDAAALAEHQIDYRNNIMINEFTSTAAVMASISGGKTVLDYANAG